MKLDDKIQNLVSVYLNGKERWSTARRDSMRCYEFVLNEQWTKEERDIFIRRGNAPMVYNMILPRLMNLIGQEQLNRRSATIRPFSNGQQELASLLNGVFKSSWETEDAEDEFMKVFVDGLINKIPGVFGVYVEPNEIGYMEYRYSALNPFAVTFDPNHRDAKLKDCDWVIVEKWMRIEEIVEMYGSRKELTLEGYEKKWWEKLSEKLVSTVESAFGIEGNTEDFYSKSENRYKVLEMQSRYTETRDLLTDIETGEFLISPKSDTKELLERSDNLRYIHETSIKKTWLSTVCPYLNVMLLDEPNWLDTPMFNVIPYYSFAFSNKKTDNSSLVWSLLDPQRNLNKREIQKTAYIDRSMVSPIMFSPEDRDAKEDYDENGNNPNFSMLIRNMRFPPKRLEPSHLGNDMWNDIADSEAKMNDISGINDAARGKSEYSNESGRLQEMKLQRVGASINPYLRSLSQSRKMIVQYFLSTFKQVYSEPNRLVNVADARGNTSQEIINMSLQGEVYNDVTSFNGRVVVDEGNNSVTKLQEQFEIKMALVNMMPPEFVNWEWILKDSDLADVQEQIDYIKMMMGMQADEAQRQKELELQQVAHSQVLAEQQMLLQKSNINKSNNQEKKEDKNEQHNK